MTTLSVANRLRLGLLALLALLLAAYLLVLRQPTPDASGVAGAAAEAQAVRGLVTSLQASAGEAWSAVESFARDRDPAQAERFRQADEQFAATLKRYADTAKTDAQRSAAQAIDEQHASYRSDVDALLSASSASDNVALFFEYQQRALRAVLDDMPTARPGRASGRTERKREAGEQLRQALQERVDAFGDPAPQGGAVPDGAPLLAALARYQAFADTAEERAWAERALRALREGDRQGDAVQSTQRERTEVFEKVLASHVALDSLLVQRTQVPTGPDPASVLAQVTGQVQRANARLADLLLGLLGAGVLVALATLYAVRAPLRRLAVSTRGYVGDLSFMALAAPGDEVAELEWALGRMSERMQEERPRTHSASDDERTRQAALAFEHGSEAMAVTDERLGIVQANAAFTELTGYPLDEVKGASPATLWSPDHHDAAAIAAMWAQVDERGRWQGEIMVRTRSGDLRPALAAITAVRDRGGRLQGAVAVLSDRTVRRPADDERPAFVHPAPVHRDAVAVATRARLAAALVEAEQGLAILRLHVVTLHSVVAALGDTDAEHLLREIRTRVAAAVGDRGEVVDNDGEEPLVLVIPLPEDLALARIAHDILAALAGPARFNGLELPVIASIGLARAPADAVDVETLIEAAGSALERARTDRGGSFEFTSAETSARMRARIALQDELRAPTLLDQLTLHYQPLVALGSGKAVGVEALLRWRHPVRGVLNPEAFLDEARVIGVLPAIGAWVLRTACVQAARWSAAGLPPLRVAVNVSRAELEDPGLTARVQEALGESGLDASLLQLEVDESSLAGPPDPGPTLEQLQRLGVVLTLASARASDAATRALTWMPFSRIKLRAPLRAQDPLAPGIVALAANLRIGVVAECVESEAQAASLRAQGVDELQGFVVGRPTAARELEMRMRHAAARAPAATAG